MPFSALVFDTTLTIHIIYFRYYYLFFGAKIVFYFYSAKKKERKITFPPPFFFFAALKELLSVPLFCPPYRFSPVVGFVCPGVPKSSLSSSPVFAFGVTCAILKRYLFITVHISNKTAL